MDNIMKPVRNVLIACTGSVATIKLSTLIDEFTSMQEHLPFIFAIKVVATNSAHHFINKSSLPNDIQILDDNDEWHTWQKRGDPVLHIELGKWADVMVIAPLSANTLAKIATGICDNLVLSITRAWDFNKLLFFAPAMNTRMYEHPLTLEHISKLKSWGYLEIPCVSKTLMCGDIGNGAMADIKDIVKQVAEYLQSTNLINN